MSLRPIDDTAALKKARKLMKKGLPAAAAARSLAALLGDPKAASRLRAKLAGRRALTLSFSAEQWVRIEEVTENPAVWAKEALLAAAWLS